MKLFRKTLAFLHGALALSVVLLAVRAGASDPALIRIGYQKYGTLNKGSNVHYFLVKALEKAGLRYTDVQTAFLPPPEARAAFESGRVDAWAIWDPFLTAAEQGTGAKVLTNAKDLAANREFYLSTREFIGKNPDFLPALIAAVNSAGQWATDRPSEVAIYLAKEVGMDAQILEPIIRREPWGFRPVDAEVIADQQAIADLFCSLKLIPRPIKVSDAVGSAARPGASLDQR